MNMTLAWPWSVPPVPFWWTVRPNSDIVTRVTFSASSPMSVQKAERDSLNSRRRFASWPCAAACVVGVPPPADVGEGGFDSEIGFEKLCDLLHALAELPLRV